MNNLRILLALALSFLPLANASAGNGTITTKDAGGVTRTFSIVTDGSGNFIARQVICDQSAAATCASVGTAGSPSTNAVTIQAVTLGAGTAANAMRVELPTDGTGKVTAAQATAANLNATVVGTGTFATQSAVTAASGSYSSGAFASGSFASGSHASGSFASGSFASGSVASGAMVDLGAQADAVCGTATGTCSLIALQKYNNATNPIFGAGTNIVGYTSNDVCAYSVKTNLPISQNGTSSVQLVALSGSTTIYVCSLSLIAAGATTVALTTGTGSACVTGNTAVIGTTTASIANSMSLAANGGLTLGNGLGTVAKGSASSELCMILGTNVFVSGNLTYVQI